SFAWFSLQEFVVQLMGWRHKLKQSPRLGRYFLQELGYFFHSPANSAGGIFLFILTSRSDRKKHRIGVVESKVARLGSFSDCRFVEQGLRILLQDPGMLPFELWAMAAQDLDGESLRPPMLKQTKARHDSQGLVLRKSDLHTLSRRVGAIERIARHCRVRRSLVATEIS